MIDKFFVVDFDRCLGSVDSSFNLMIDIVTDLRIVDSKELLEARHEAESKRISFSVFSYIKNVKTNVDFGVIEAEYIKRAKKNPMSLQEPGAGKFINYLINHGEYFCIMSYGDPHWQAVKISAAGFSDIPLSLVDTKYKTNHILKWYDDNSEVFTVPADNFVDKTTRSTREIILIDDKQSAFKDLPKGVRGYWVQNHSGPTAFWSGEKHELIQTVSSIDEIIDLESSYSHS